MPTDTLLQIMNGAASPQRIYEGTHLNVAGMTDMQWNQVLTVCTSPRLKVDPPGRTFEWSVSEA